MPVRSYRPAGWCLVLLALAACGEFTPLEPIVEQDVRPMLVVAEDPLFDVLLNDLESRLDGDLIRRLALESPVPLAEVPDGAPLPHLAAYRLLMNIEARTSATLEETIALMAIRLMLERPEPL